jgi:hypothetical protein
MVVTPPAAGDTGFAGVHVHVDHARQHDLAGGVEDGADVVDRHGAVDEPDDALTVDEQVGPHTSARQQDGSARHPEFHTHSATSTVCSTWLMFASRITTSAAPR